MGGCTIQIHATCLSFTRDPAYVIAFTILAIVSLHVNGWEMYDRAPPPEQMFQSKIPVLRGKARRTVEIPLGIAEQLHSSCEAVRVEPLTLFRAACLFVLHVYTGADSLCFGYSSGISPSEWDSSSSSLQMAMCQARIQETDGIRNVLD